MKYLSSYLPIRHWQIPIVFFLCAVATAGNSYAQALVGTSWKANSSLVTALSSSLSVPLDSVVMKFNPAAAWQMIFYPTGSEPPCLGTWTQIDASNFSFSDTSLSSIFYTHSICTPSEVDTDTYNITSDTMHITATHGGCTFRETIMTGDWYGPISSLNAGHESLPEPGMQVFPNPFEDVIRIRVIGGINGTESIKLRLSDMTGRPLLDQSAHATNSIIELTGLQRLPTGIYDLTIEQNGVIVHNKVVRK